MNCPHGKRSGRCAKCDEIVKALAPRSRAIAVELERLLPKKTHSKQRELVSKLCETLCLEMGAYYEGREAILRSSWSLIASMLDNINRSGDRAVKSQAADSDHKNVIPIKPRG